MGLIIDSSVIIAAERRALPVSDMLTAISRVKGVVIPLADLQIGATVLHFGCPIVTHNRRHFEMIPDLVVKHI